MHNLRFSIGSPSRRPVQRRISRLAGLSTVAGMYLIALALGGLPAIASAQLLGDSGVQPATDTDDAGLAEAFQVKAASTGTVNTLNVYVDSSSRATQVAVGLYSNVNGGPASLLAQGNTAHPVTGAWNTISVAPTNVTAGVTYWVAVLGTGGTLAFRDDCCGGGTPSQNSAQTNLTSLPGSWSPGAHWSDGALSAYAPSATLGQVSSGTATVSWTPPTTNTNGSTLTNLAGYKIHYGTSSNSLNQTVQVTNAGLASYVLNNLSGGATWYFGITAYTSTGAESALSNIGSKTIQ
jgi:Fibronectin type III domain